MRPLRQPPGRDLPQVGGEAVRRAATRWRDQHCGWPDAQHDQWIVTSAGRRCASRLGRSATEAKLAAKEQHEGRRSRSGDDDVACRPATDDLRAVVRSGARRPVRGKARTGPHSSFADPVGAQAAICSRAGGYRSHAAQAQRALRPGALTNHGVPAAPEQDGLKNDRSSFAVGSSRMVRLVAAPGQRTRCRGTDFSTPPWWRSAGG